MGVNGLWTALGPAADERTSLDRFASDFLVHHGRSVRIAIDVYALMFKTKGYVVRAVMAKLLYLVGLNVSFVVVFDGRFKPAKRADRVDETTRNTDFTTLYTQFAAVDPQDYHEVDVDLEIDIHNLKKELSNSDIQWIQAPGEGEAQCAHLCRLGVVDYVLLDDVDSLLFGARGVLRDLAYDQDSDMYWVTPVLMSNIEAILGYTTNRLIFLVVMCGGDYSGGAKGIGIENALRISLWGTPYHKVKAHGHDFGKMFDGVLESIGEDKREKVEEEGEDKREKVEEEGEDKREKVEEEGEDKREKIQRDLEDLQGNLKDPRGDLKDPNEHLKEYYEVSSEASSKDFPIDFPLEPSPGSPADFLSPLLYVALKDLANLINEELSYHSRDICGRKLPDKARVTLSAHDCVLYKCPIVHPMVFKFLPSLSFGELRAVDRDITTKGVFVRTDGQRVIGRLLVSAAHLHSFWPISGLRVAVDRFPVPDTYNWFLNRVALKRLGVETWLKGGSKIKANMEFVMIRYGVEEERARGRSESKQSQTRYRTPSPRKQEQTRGEMILVEKKLSETRQSETGQSEMEYLDFSESLFSSQNGKFGRSPTKSESSLYGGTFREPPFKSMKSPLKSGGSFMKSRESPIKSRESPIKSGGSPIKSPTKSAESPSKEKYVWVLRTIVHHFFPDLLAKHEADEQQRRLPQKRRYDAQSSNLEGFFNLDKVGQTSPTKSPRKRTKMSRQSLTLDMLLSPKKDKGKSAGAGLLEQTGENRGQEEFKSSRERNMDVSDKKISESSFLNNKLEPLHLPRPDSADIFWLAPETGRKTLFTEKISEGERDKGNANQKLAHEEDLKSQNICNDEDTCEILEHSIVSVHSTTDSEQEPEVVVIDSE